jgi:ABC-type phosphate/phosphonate transport system substrate-binding protein
MSRKSFFATLLVALMILLTACGEGETSGKTNNSNGGAAANADVLLQHLLTEEL